MKTCPACHQRNSDETVNCSSCGFSFQQSIKPTDPDSSYSKTSGFSPGDLIANRYEVVKELGRGGMGVVYLVKDTRLQNRQEALKMIHPQLVENPQARQRFEQEVGICLDLLHSNIVRVHDLKEWQGQPYFTMEYVSGRSLRQLINERKDKKPPFSLTEASAIIHPLLDALSYAHTFTVHRDVKPENIITTGEFPNLNIKVLDFGIAKTLSPSRFSMTSQMLGTPYYIAPEQTSSSDVDHRADLFAVGVVLYELLTGRMPMGRFRLPSELVDGLSKALDEVVEKSLSPLPEERYANAAEMKNALSRALLEEAKAAEKRQADEAKRRQEEEIKELLSQAQSAVGGRQWERAERLCKRVVGLSPGHPGAAELAKKAAAAKETLAKLEKELKQAEASGDLPRALELCDSLSGLVEDAAKVKERKTRIQDQLQKRQRQEEESRRRQEAEAVRLREEEEKLKAGEKRSKEEEEAARRREAGIRPGHLFAGLAAVLILVGLLVLWKPWEREPVKSEPSPPVAMTKPEPSVPPPKPEVATGRLFVSTDPESARVVVEGINESYRAGMELKKERYRVTVSNPGYKDSSDWVEVRPGEETRVRFRLEPEAKTTRLVVETEPAGARVEVLNIKPVYQRGMELDPGRYNIRVSHPGYLTKTEWVELAAGREGVFRFVLEKVPVGRVVVRSEPPGARFDIGGKFAGTTPAEVKDLPAGSYTINISKDGYEDWTQSFEVKADQESRVQANLKEVVKTGAVAIRSEPSGAQFDIGGRHKGTTPAELKGVEAGSYRVTMKKDGYEDWVGQVEVKPGATSELPAELRSKVPMAGQVIDGPLAGMKFAYIPPGTFMMGSPSNEAGRDDDETQRQVTLTRAFYLMTTEVTVGHFKQFVQESGYRTEAETGGGAYVWTGKEWQKQAGAYWGNPGFSQSDSHPVTCVSWNDAQAFIKWLNGKAGGNRYRLPTEAEWEYAARARTQTSRFWGDNPDSACRYANVADRSAKKKYQDWVIHECDDGYAETAPVAKYEKNAFGLYDMIGNVWEWCSDWYGNYPSGAVTGPPGPSSGAFRVLRGGSWYGIARFCRSAIRLYYDPGLRSLHAGFRLAGQF